MQSKSFRPLFLFYVLVLYLFVQFAWWSYLLLHQNNDIYQLKSQINLFQYHDPQLIIEKGNELEKKLHSRWGMIVGEAIVFIVLITIVFLKVRNTFKKETELASQQKNFLLSITHELKSPIASAKLQLETLLKHELEKEKQKQLISNAITDTERLNKLVENILLAAKIDTSEFELYKEKINLSAYLEEGMKQTIQTFSPKQNVTLDIQPNIVFSIDKTLFPSIVLNLFENAVKYSPDTSLIKIGLKEQGNGVVLSVQDEGNGIPEEEKQNIFKKFYRVGNEEIRKTKGTGLGLYIIKHIVEKHNGTIVVKNNYPKGTIIEVILYG